MPNGRFDVIAGGIVGTGGFSVSLRARAGTPQAGPEKRKPCSLQKARIRSIAINLVGLYGLQIAAICKRLRGCWHWLCNGFRRRLGIGSIGRFHRWIVSGFVGILSVSNVLEEPMSRQSATSHSPCVLSPIATTVPFTFNPTV